MAKATFACPACKSPVWDNRRDKRSEKAPDYRCSDKNCTGDPKGGGAWVCWGEPKGIATTPAPVGEQPRQSKPAAPAHRLTQDDFILVTQDMTFVLLDHAIKTCLTHHIWVSPDVLYREVSTTVRQAWIEHERGVIRLGPEPPAPPAPRSKRDEYHEQINQQTEVMPLMRLMGVIGGDMTLDGTDKEELASIAEQRFATIKAAAQLQG